jgi:hypothetical protein
MQHEAEKRAAASSILPGYLVSQKVVPYFNATKRSFGTPPHSGA